MIISRSRNTIFSIHVCLIAPTTAAPRLLTQDIKKRADGVPLSAFSSFYDNSRVDEKFAW